MVEPADELTETGAFLAGELTQAAKRSTTSNMGLNRVVPLRAVPRLRNKGPAIREAGKVVEGDPSGTPGPGHDLSLLDRGERPKAVLVVGLRGFHDLSVVRSSWSVGALLRWREGETAVLAGTVNPENSDTSYYFEYGAIISCGLGIPDVMVRRMGFG